jgi:hypothetical protein
MPPAVVRHLNAQSHVFRQYQRSEWQGMRTDWSEKDPWDLHYTSKTYIRPTTRRNASMLAAGGRLV